jgi:hypothetical protein
MAGAHLQIYLSTFDRDGLRNILFRNECLVYMTSMSKETLWLCVLGFHAGNLTAIAKTLIFPVDHPNETEKKLIAKFGYWGHPNNRIIQLFRSPE